MSRSPAFIPASFRHRSDPQARCQPVRLTEFTLTAFQASAVQEESASVSQNPRRTFPHTFRSGVSHCERRRHNVPRRRLDSLNNNNRCPALDTCDR